MPTKSEIKYIQSLSHKKFREEEGVFVAEGVKMISELLIEYNSSIRKIFATEEWVEANRINLSASVDVETIEDFQLVKLSHLQTPQQVLAVVEFPKKTIESYKSSGITIVLDQLQDPGNLGTIIRTCDWFGISSVVCSLNTVDAFNPKVVQSSMGSVMRVNVFYTDLVDFIKKNKSIPKYAAVLNGTPLKEIKWQSPCFLIIGNESNGISEDIIDLSTQQISIPRLGKAESLNAAVASAIILADMMR